MVDSRRSAADVDWLTRVRTHSQKVSRGAGNDLLNSAVRPSRQAHIRLVRRRIDQRGCPSPVPDPSECGSR